MKRYEEYMKKMSKIFSYPELSGYRGPTALINNWRRLIEACEKGYDFSVWDYYDEVSVRSLIEKFLSNELHDFEEFKKFKEEVSCLDRRLLNIMKMDLLGDSDKQYWWYTGVLKYAGEEYAATVKHKIGVAVQVKH